MLSDYFSEINDHGTVVPVKDLAAFPRSEQAVLGAKNFALPNVLHFALAGSVGNSVFVANNDVIGFCAKVEKNTDYTWDYVDGDRYRLALSASYPVNNGTCYIEYVNDTGVKTHTFNSGNYEYAYLYCYNNNDKTYEEIKPLCTLASDTDRTFVPYAMTNKELTEKVTPIDIKSSVTMTEQSHYSIDGATNISRNGIMCIVNGVITSVDKEEQPVGHGWTTIMTALPKAFKASATLIPSSDPAKNPINVNVTTNGELNVRGGSVGEYYYFNLTYLIQ